MRNLRFSEEQTIGIPWEQESGAKTAELCDVNADLTPLATLDKIAESVDDYNEKHPHSDS